MGPFFGIDFWRDLLVDFVARFGTIFDYFSTKMTKMFRGHIFRGNFGGDHIYSYSFRTVFAHVSYSFRTVFVSFSYNFRKY